MPKKNGDLTARELKQQEERSVALDLVRCQAFNWALSIGFEQTRDRWLALDEVTEGAEGGWNGLDEPEATERRLNFEARKATMQGLEDAGRRMGWVENDD